MNAAYVDREENLDLLVTHCIAARAVIEQAGTSAMRQLIDLLLFEVGVALAAHIGEDAIPERRQ